MGRLKKKVVKDYTKVIVEHVTLLLVTAINNIFLHFRNRVSRKKCFYELDQEHRQRIIESQTVQTNFPKPYENRMRHNN